MTPGMKKIAAINFSALLLVWLGFGFGAILLPSALFFSALLLVISVANCHLLGRKKAFSQSAYQKIEDIGTDRVEVEKMSLLAINIAGAAHELRNPLMGIENYILYALDPEKNLEKKTTYLNSALTETRRCNSLIDNLMRFSRKYRPEKGPSTEDLSEVVVRSVEMVQFQINSTNALVKLEVAKDLPKVLLARGELEQVLINLITNALDAMEPQQHKTLTISSDDSELAQGFLVLNVKDNGPGIDKAILSQIWDPLFTTKAAGKGTGLGLANVKHLMDGMGAQVEVHSTPGEGTTFTLKFQRA